MTHSGGNIVYYKEHLHSDRPEFETLSQLTQSVILDYVPHPPSLCSLCWGVGVGNGSNYPYLSWKTMLADYETHGKHLAGGGGCL